MNAQQAVAFFLAAIALSCLGGCVYGTWHEVRFGRRKFG